jgi:calcineurin-like phosphoesterase family protein
MGKKNMVFIPPARRFNINNTYVTTDLHFNHKKIIEYSNRPIDFETMIFNNMKFLKSDYLLICLGDVCIGEDHYVHSKFIRPLECRKVLIRGNHDSKSLTWYMNNGWDFACDRFDLNVFGKNLVFSHKPIKHDGAWDINIHGHVHSQLPRLLRKDFLSKSEEKRNEKELALLTDRHRLIVLEDTQYRPVNLRKIVERRKDTYIDNNSE